VVVAVDGVVEMDADDSLTCASMSSSRCPSARGEMCRGRREARVVDEVDE